MTRRARRGDPAAKQAASGISRDRDPRERMSVLRQEPSVEVVPLDLSDTGVASAVLTLQRRAYEVEAGLIGSDDIPPLRETLEELRTSGGTFLGVLIGGRVVGAVSYRLAEDTLDLHRLVVDPVHFRGRIGTTLVRAALTAEPGATRAIVQTGADNEPVKALYLKEGFEQTDELEVVPGLRVARFSKSLP